MAVDEEIGRLEGIVLAVSLVVYIAWTVVTAKRRPGLTIPGADDDLDPESLRAASVGVDLGYVIGGLVLLIVGSQALVRSASDIATELGVSDLMIGLTVVAIGTSLPEVATSVLAAMRGERDLAVGNAIGSNLFNLLGVLGITAAVAPDSIPVAQSAIQVDIPVMIVVAVACLPIFANGHVLKRWEGTLFFLFYVAYIAWLVVDAAEHSVRDDYSNVMLFFVVPLTAITLTVIGIRSNRSDVPIQT